MKYHPDKNSDKNACTKFQEIHQAYDFLYNKYDGDFHENDDEDEDDFDEYYDNNGKFISFLNLFLKRLFKNEKHAKIMRIIINHIFTLCESKSLDYLKKIDFSILTTIYNVLKKYAHFFHIHSDYLEKMNEIIEENKREHVKREATEATEEIKEIKDSIILHPLLSDLLEANVFKLCLNGENYMVPLWFHDLIYETSENSEIVVQCFPILPEGITIDDNNNLFIEIECALHDIWGKELFEINVGEIVWEIPTRDLKFTNQMQQIEIKNKPGIPMMHETEMYNIERRANICICLTITEKKQ